MHSRNLSIYHGSKYAIYDCLLDFDFEDSVTPADDEIIVLPDKILERYQMVLDLWKKYVAT